MLINVVCVDMFQTLIDVNSMRYYFWRKILGENYSEALANEYTRQWGRLFPDHFNNAVSKADGFLCLKHIFERFNADFLPQLGKEKTGIIVSNPIMRWNPYSKLLTYWESRQSEC